MQISFTTLGCPDWSLEQIAANAKDYGYDGVELRVNNDGNHLSPDTSLADAEEVGRQFRDTGAPITCVMGYSSFASQDEAAVAGNQAVLEKLIALAAAMQAPYIRTFAGQLPEGTTLEAMIEIIARALKPLAQQAADKGISIGIETHDDWCAAANIMAIINQVDSPGLGIVYDISNSTTAEPWEQTYAAIKDHICYCHVKDSWTLPDGTHQYVMLGAGDMPYPEIFACLKADGFDSFLSLEWEKKWIPELAEPEEIFPHYAHKIRQLWNRV